MIPKIIHYCWFGGNDKPELVEKCLESWKKFFPGYKIIEWNESNYDVYKVPYISEAYQCKKWAFVSDYARFDILYNYGGIYFDTDVEVLQQFPEELFELQGFTGVESTNEIAPGLVFACEKGHLLLKSILTDYENSHFIVDGKEQPITVNSKVGSLLEERGFKKDGSIQEVAGIRVYPSEWFCGFDLDVFEPDIRKQTLSIHHYASTWAYKSFSRKRKAQIILKRMVGIKNYRRILNSVRKMRNMRNK